MQRVGLVLKPGQPNLTERARELVEWLTGRGIRAAAEEEVRSCLDSPHVAPLAEADFQDQDLLVVLGGDGTLLRAARLAHLSGVPLLGVNLGGLGFLTAVTTEELLPTLQKILNGRLRPEERMRLDVQVARGGEIVFKSVVLNDAVLTKGALARIVDLTAAIDGRHLTDYRADGLIIATPTGSTAYNLSAGGPILDPTLAAMILTPICPFTLANRPLVVADTVRVAVRLGGRAEDVYLTCDGQEGLPLLPGDELTVRRSQNLKLFPSPFHDHLSILRTKLGWGVDRTSLLTSGEAKPEREGGGK